MDILFTIEPFHDFQTVVQDVLSNLYNSKQLPSMLMEPDVFAQVKQEVKTILNNCDYNVIKISELLNTKAWDRDKINYFLKLTDIQKTDLLCCAVNHYNSTCGEIVEDFDWCLKYILGTSELKTLNCSILQLTLSLLNSNQDRNKVIYDINRDMLSKIIDSLENVN